MIIFVKGTHNARVHAQFYADSHAAIPPVGASINIEGHIYDVRAQIWKFDREERQFSEVRLEVV